MNIFTRLGAWSRSTLGKIVIAVLLVSAVAFAYLSGQDDALVSSDPVLPLVELTTPIDYAGGQSLSLIGNVRAFTEASVTSERGGRVTGVNVTLGQTVQAGQVIATLENASERAAVLQAEGAYDSAQASLAQARAADAQSNVGLDESQSALRSAQNAAVNSYKSAFTTVNGVILNNVDTFFANPNGTVPGLRLDGFGNAIYLNNERVAYQFLLPEWQRSTNALTATDNLQSALSEAEANIDRTLAIVDMFVTLFNRQDVSRYSEAELQTFSTNFTNLRSSLIAAKSSLDSARIGLQNAADVGTRADISTSVSAIPAADAQVKQALGALRAAQANLAKTVLRTPISGTINALNVRTGDFLTGFSSVAQVANNDALEIVTYISDSERTFLAVGDTVLIEGKYEGLVANISPVVDPGTRKIEVRIATEGTNIQNGDTVRVTKEVEAANTTTILVPITAVKFEIDDGFIMLYSDGVLNTRAVELGQIRGGSVEILEGLAVDESFVVDARGLQAGDAVTVRN